MSPSRRAEPPANIAHEPQPPDGAPRITVPGRYTAGARAPHAELTCGLVAAGGAFAWTRHCPSAVSSCRQGQAVRRTRMPEVSRFARRNPCQPPLRSRQIGHRIATQHTPATTPPPPPRAPGEGARSILRQPLARRVDGCSDSPRLRLCPPTHPPGACCPTTAALTMTAALVAIAGMCASPPVPDIESGSTKPFSRAQFQLHCVDPTLSSLRNAFGKGTDFQRAKLES